MRRFFASTSAWVAMASLVAGFLVLDLVAAVPNSPTVPPLLAGAGPARWMVRSATALGLDGLGRGALTAIALVLVAVLLAAWAVLLREAWRSRVGAGPVAVA